MGPLPDSPLDPLGPANTPFSLVDPEIRLSQPTIRQRRSSTACRSTSTRSIGRPRGSRCPRATAASALGRRRTTCGGGRLGDPGAGGPCLRERARRSTGPSCLRRAQPPADLRPAFHAGATGGVDAVYTEVLQIGGEARDDAGGLALFAEGFGRRGALDVTGRERTYGYVAAAAEYQRLGAFGGAYNLIPRFEFMADTRGDRADIPFASVGRAGMRIATTQLLPVQVDVGLFSRLGVSRPRRHGAVEKALAESPTVNIGLPVHGLLRGAKRSILDIWKDDLELLRLPSVELSR